MSRGPFISATLKPSSFSQKPRHDPHDVPLSKKRKRDAQEPLQDRAVAGTLEWRSTEPKSAVEIHCRHNKLSAPAREKHLPSQPWFFLVEGVCQEGVSEGLLCHLPTNKPAPWAHAFWRSGALDMAKGGPTGHMGTSKCDDGALGREMKRSAITGSSALLSLALYYFHPVCIWIFLFGPLTCLSRNFSGSVAPTCSYGSSVPP
ncbi:hypothetical protein QR685DRAFT_24472 [Neurospora intermedia]|uniref:Uncharacterized protein n=1 Tax=Neurospora intermedia TaxID=5142 RepID=A0ABR3DQB5_NEUIN